MKGSFAWILFVLAAIACLTWIGFSVRADLHEDAVFFDIIEKRIDMAESAKGEVHFGVAGDWTKHREMLTGIKMAAKEINGAGGILGRKIVLNVKDDRGSVEEALAVAQEFAVMPEVAFVIGHTQFKLNVEVAEIYEFYGLLSMTPNISTLGAYNASLSLFYENGLPPEQIGNAILDFARKNNWTRLGLIYNKDDLSKRYARRFETLANREDIEVPLAFAFTDRGTEMGKHIERWKRELDLDAIVLAIDNQDIFFIASQIRTMGIDCPLLLTCNKPEKITIAEQENVGDIYFLDTPKAPAYMKFARRYVESFAHVPSAEATLGFDSLFILSQGITQANSFVPAQVAKTFKSNPIRESVSGSLRFDKYGTALKESPQFVRP